MEAKYGFSDVPALRETLSNMRTSLSMALDLEPENKEFDSIMRYQNLKADSFANLTRAMDSLETKLEGDSEDSDDEVPLLDVSDDEMHPPSEEPKSNIIQDIFRSIGALEAAAPQQRESKRAKKRRNQKENKGPGFGPVPAGPAEPFDPNEEQNEGYEGPGFEEGKAEEQKESVEQRQARQAREADEAIRLFEEQERMQQEKDIRWRQDIAMNKDVTRQQDDDWFFTGFAEFGSAATGWMPQEFKG